MNIKPTRIELSALSEAFLALRHPEDLSEAIAAEPLHLHAVAAAPQYHIFQVPKKDGSLRLIEDPHKPLKRIHRALNRFLQAVYYFRKTESAYGFTAQCANDEPHEHRNIVNNARRHLGAPWLLNVDLEDFFHHVKDLDLARIWLSPPFSFEEELAGLLVRLCTFKGRLPMGAPTSPILSNFAAELLDKELEQLARSRGWTYTRYADDMSFSSQEEIAIEDITLIRTVIRAFDFYPNEEKVKLYGPKEPKLVTGIVVGENKFELPPLFTEELEREIDRLGEVVTVQGLMGKERSRWVEEYRQRIGGMLEFAGFVLGERHEKVTGLERAFEKAVQPPDNYGAYSWLDFPYV